MDWQNYKAIREGLNRLPGGQEPQPQPYITNMPQNVAHMEKEADIKEIEEALRAANEAERAIIPLYRSMEVEDEEMHNRLATISKGLEKMKKCLYFKWQELTGKRAVMSQSMQAMQPPPQMRPPSMN